MSCGPTAHLPEAGEGRAFDPPDRFGVVRIHFYNRDGADGAGPLSRRNAARRTTGLARMFTAIRRTHPSATTVRGASWLYNIEAYRRLFPPDYTQSRTEPAAVQLIGTSSWGQFLDHCEGLKTELAKVFLANLDRLDTEAPWRAFPLRALVTEAPIEVFYRLYEGKEA